MHATMVEPERVLCWRGLYLSFPGGEYSAMERVCVGVSSCSLMDQTLSLCAKNLDTVDRYMFALPWEGTLSDFKTYWFCL